MCISFGDYVNCKCSVLNYIIKNFSILVFGGNKKKKLCFGFVDSRSL